MGVGVVVLVAAWEGEEEEEAEEVAIVLAVGDGRRAREMEAPLRRCVVRLRERMIAGCRATWTRMKRKANGNNNKNRKKRKMLFLLNVLPPPHNQSLGLHAQRLPSAEARLKPRHGTSKGNQRNQRHARLGVDFPRVWQTNPTLIIHASAGRGLPT